MVKEITRSELRVIHKRTNPEIMFDLFEWNYGWLTVEAGYTLNVYDNGKKVLSFTNGESYFDKRKPNERQTTD